MPLIKTVLSAQLTNAFSAAMYKFIEISAQPNSNDGVDKSDLAISAASATFADQASTAIDAYIKSGSVTTTVTTVVATSGGPGTGVGTGTGAII